MFKIPEPSVLRVQSLISEPELTEVDASVTEAIGFYGEEVFAVIINGMLGFDIECQSAKPVNSERVQIYRYVTESPVHGRASLGLVNGSLESIQMSDDQTGLSELKAVTPTCDSSISVTIQNGKISWIDTPLYWRCDSTEFCVKGEGFETLVRYLSCFAKGFDVARLERVVNRIEGIRRGGDVLVPIEGGSNNESKQRCR
jgi:hypothetical protein